MKNYELLFIVNQNLQEEEIGKVIADVQGMISSNSGSVADTDKWGSRKLATHFEKQESGYYVLVRFSGNGSTLDKLNNYMNISEKVVRYLITVKEEKKVVAKAAAVESKK